MSDSVSFIPVTLTPEATPAGAPPAMSPLLSQGAQWMAGNAAQHASSGMDDLERLLQSAQQDGDIDEDHLERAANRFVRRLEDLGASGRLARQDIRRAQETLIERLATEVTLALESLLPAGNQDKLEPLLAALGRFDPQLGEEIAQKTRERADEPAATGPFASLGLRG